MESHWQELRATVSFCCQKWYNLHLFFSSLDGIVGDALIIEVKFPHMVRSMYVMSNTLPRLFENDEGQFT